MAEDSIDCDMLISNQYELLDLLKKQFSNFKKDNSDRKTEIYFKKRLSTIETYYTQFHSNHKFLKPHVEKTAPYIKDSILNVFEETYFDISVQIQEAFENKFPPKPAVTPKAGPSNPRNENVNNDTRVRLPKINLQSFSGNCLEWPSFADAFKTVHDDNKSSNAQKFQYLKGVLSGPAELLIRYFSITDENYNLAYAELERNYNDRRLIFTQQMNLFMDLANIRVESADSIRELVSVSRASMHVLENLNVAVCEPIFVHMVLQKLPSETDDDVLSSTVSNKTNSCMDRFRKSY